MSFAQRSIIPGTHLLLFPESKTFTIPIAGTAGRSSKPGATDAGWLDCGPIEDGEVEYQSEEIKIFAPTPGRSRLYNKLETKQEIMISATCKEMQAYIWELLFRSLALTSSSTQFNPMAGVEKNAWVKLQVYDQTDTIALTLDVWCSIKLKGALKMSGSLIEPVVEGSVLYSTLNTGTL